MKKLTKPAQIPDPYRDIVLAFLRDYFDAEIQTLQDHFGIELPAADRPVSDKDFLQLKIAQNCEAIARAAVGDTDGLDRSQVLSQVRGLVTKLFSVPGESDYEFPRAFWLSDFGNMVLLGMVWGLGDELITVSQAVELTGRPHNYFTHAAQRGRFTTYPDKTEPNPTRRTRLLKSEVLAVPARAQPKKRAAR